MQTPELINQFDDYFYFLSNFYPCFVTYKGLHYLNSEGAYQAAKCADPADIPQFTVLSADEAKRLGAKVTLRSDWDEVKIPVMEEIVKAKFTQNPKLKRYLLETGEAILQEGNYWHDVFWGVDLKTGEGENHLGQILMALRAEFRAKGLAEMPQSEPFCLKETYEGHISACMQDMTTICADCIVHAMHKNVTEKESIFPELLRVAGDGLLSEFEALGGCQTGEAKLTGAYKLPTRYIIHTVGPRYGQKDGEEILKQTYRAVLALARDAGVQSIVFPVISVGRFSFPKELAAKIAVESVWAWKKETGDDISVIFSTMDMKVYRCLCFWMSHMQDETMPDFYSEG